VLPKFDLFGPYFVSCWELLWLSFVLGSSNVLFRKRKRCEYPHLSALVKYLCIGSGRCLSYFLSFNYFWTIKWWKYLKHVRNLSKLCIVSQVPAIECQWFSTYLDPNIYSSKIAPARTFCIFEEVYSYIYYMFVITSFHYVLLTCIGSAFTCMNYLIGPLLILCD